MYFNRGSLPWQGLRATHKKEKYEKIMEKKMSVSLENLCKNYPAEFVNYLNYSRSLRFEDKPDYPYLRRNLRDLSIQLNLQYDGLFDWTVLNYQTNMTSLSPQQAQASGAAPPPAPIAEEVGDNNQWE